MPRNVDPSTITSSTLATDSNIKADLLSSSETPVIESVWENLEGNDTSVPFDTDSVTPIESTLVRKTSDFYISKNVSGILDEVVGVLPPEPPKLGKMSILTENTGIPDWGRLKKVDRSFFERDGESDNDAVETYPYYLNLIPPNYLDGGSDEETDIAFNSGLPSGSLYGAGPGQTHSGSFTNGTSSPSPLSRTVRVMHRSSTIDGSTGLPERTEVVVSGMVYPADRGVLALIHWPFEGDTNSFLAQDLQDRCIAAILMGQGILNSNSATQPCDTEVCDGEAGGIFSVGTTNNKYDIYAFPGRATGQYDLKELLLGETLDGDPLPSPYDDLDEDSVAGAKRIQDSTTPAVGQVRLGTDPQAGEVLEYGIPILGADRDAYSPIISDTIQSHYVLGNTVLETSTSQKPNFFAYRLPYLKDYQYLKYVDVDNRGRFHAAYEPATILTLPKAGTYENYDQDYFTWQMARYRHMFLMPSTAAVGEPEQVGSYWLVHFKKEVDFEKFVRDGIMPWDATDGYEVYGASLVNSTFEDVSNILRTDTKDPYTYGFESTSYHNLRATIFHKHFLFLQAIHT